MPEVNDSPFLHFELLPNRANVASNYKLINTLNPRDDFHHDEDRFALRDGDCSKMELYERIALPLLEFVCTAWFFSE